MSQSMYAVRRERSTACGPFHIQHAAGHERGEAAQQLEQDEVILSSRLGGMNLCVDGFLVRHQCAVAIQLFKNRERGLSMQQRRGLISELRVNVAQDELDFAVLTSFG